MKIYRRVSKKKYLHGKRVYEYERLYIPIPKRYLQILKPFIGKNVKVKVEPEAEGFVVRVQVRSRQQSPTETFNKHFRNH